MQPFERAARGVRDALAVSVIAFGGLMAAPALSESMRGDVQRGFELALKVCEDCHVVADRRRSKRPPAPGAPTFFDLAADKKVTAFYLRAFFRTPHKNMPDLILARRERDDVIAYILSLRPLR